jgi:tRNA-splicing ligase RtcB
MRNEKTYGELYDQELVYAPIKSKVGEEYFSAMACAANFAFANKQIMTHEIRKIFSEYFPNSKVDLVYDICHNIAKIEKHTVDGVEKKLCVHRKGATRSLGPGHKDVAKKYREVGQPVLIPGSMGTSSFVMVGDKNAEKLTFSSSVHGAGRVLSRTKAMRKIKGEKILKELNSEGISVNSSSLKSVSQEAPSVYKNIDEVIEVIHSLKISRKVARLFPLVVIMG